MKFTPRDEAEIQKEAAKFGPWPNGVYDFEISDAEDRTSAAGNDMLVLTLHVFNQEGDRRTVFDYLLEKIPHKLKHAAEACGLHQQYEAGNLDKHDFFGKTGRLKLGMQPEKDGYQAKNVVRDYIPEKTDAVQRPAARPKAMASVHAGRPDLDDEIPF